MIQNGRDLVEQSHREEIERHLAGEENKRGLVEAMFEQALVRQLEADARGRALVDAMHREACEQYCRNSPPPVERPKGVHYTELQEKKPDEPLADEWNTYCREIGRLLAEEQEGRHVLIKGREIIGIFDTSDLAFAEGHKRYLGQPFLVHPIRTEEPYLRIRGVNYPWPSSLSR